MWIIPDRNASENLKADGINDGERLVMFAQRQQSLLGCALREEGRG